MSRTKSSKTDAFGTFYVAWIVLIGVGGVTLLLMSLAGATTIWEIERQQSELRELPDVLGAAPGTRAVLDGRVAALVAPIDRNYVAYVREKYTGGGRGPRWTVIGTATQPLDVETGSKTYRIANKDYLLDRLLPDEWTDTQEEYGEPTWTEGVKRIQGITAGGPAMAVGYLEPDGTDLVFRAERLVGVPRVTYAERLASAYDTYLKTSGSLALIGLIGIIFGWRGVRRIMAAG